MYAAIPADNYTKYSSISDCRFALPALLPLITPDLHLTEQQGALLTAGYAVSITVLKSTPEQHYVTLQTNIVITS